LLELLIHQPIFIGFKADNSLRQRLESLSDSDKKYVSAEDSAFLRICRVGEDTYVGKIIRAGLTTDQVDDIRRNVLSIIRRLECNVRVPSNLKIFACSEVGADSLLTAPQLISPRTVPLVPVPRPAVR
jgi:hypothetical protein